MSSHPGASCASHGAARGSRRDMRLSRATASSTLAKAPGGSGGTRGEPRLAPPPRSHSVRPGTAVGTGWRSISRASRCTSVWPGPIHCPLMSKTREGSGGVEAMAERVRPPTRSRASNTPTELPARWSANAAWSPASPAPTMTKSASGFTKLRNMVKRLAPDAMRGCGLGSPTRTSRCAERWAGTPDQKPQTNHQLERQVRDVESERHIETAIPNLRQGAGQDRQHGQQGPDRERPRNESRLEEQPVPEEGSESEEQQGHVAYVLPKPMKENGERLVI